MVRRGPRPAPIQAPADRQAQRIDAHLYLVYDASMKTRLPVIQPDECCEVPAEPAPLSDERRQRVLAVFKALADGTRFDVFRLIAAQPEAICACDIVDRFDVSQPTIAHHLKVLREAGLVTVSRQGVWAYYGVDSSGMDLLDAVLHMLAVPVKDLALTG